ncbi:MAG: hypothetical protein NUV77_06760 [Thermoguttaceae bacterium]|jgi:hypothetical protein|nr:hypothetical protein [Thermoguttaceae bacterium]
MNTRGSLFLLALCGLPSSLVLAAEARDSAGRLTRYVDPVHQTAVPFGMRSHWLQPWRAYLETVPAARLREAVGINLNVEPDEADAVCRHLAKNGFVKVRVEFGWGSIRWDDPKRLACPERFEKVVGACKRHGLRPLFLLNAHHGVPCPVQFFDVTLAQKAKKGDRAIRVDPAVLPRIVPGRSGLSGLTDYWAGEVLFVKTGPDGLIELSKPLPKDLPAGKAHAATLKYLPFYPSRRASDGRVPPQFAETMAGWLDYTEAIAREAQRVLGTEGSPDAGFDLEVWNELTFGSKFLSINHYYEKPVAEGEWAPKEILRQTVAWVVDPKNRLPGVGVCDGFNNQWPWGAGSTAPPGLAALGKHPYAGVRRFPQDQGPPSGIRPVDALGRPNGIPVAPDRWKDRFVPKYVAHFPEYFLTAIQTEHLIRDLSPITTELYGVKHGRATHPVWPDGRAAKAPELWITEVNLDPRGADPGDLTTLARGGKQPVAPGLTPGDADRMKAKAVLRYLVSFVNKGTARIYFFAAKDRDPMGLALLRGEFFRDLKANRNQYPADDGPLTSPAMLAVRRLVGVMSGGAAIQRPRSLDLVEIAEEHGHKQFEGDPATAGKTPNPHPPLYHRDVVGFFPYQAGDGRFVVGVYVMTRNLAHLYRPDAPASDASRFDLPAERYQLSIRGVLGPQCTARLYDPLDDKDIPMKVLRTAADQIVVEIPLTDSPRLLVLEDRP